MIKRIFAVCLMVGAVVASTDAFASRARQQVMGTADPLGVFGDGTHGSLYYDDNLNVLYNPAYVNDFKNWVAIEKTNGLMANTASNTSEGGFVADIMNWRVGLYMNRGDAINIAPGGAASYTDTGVFSGGSASYARRANYRPVDFMVGADMGVKWGVGLTYGAHKAVGNSNNNDSQDMTVRAGASVMDFEPFVHYKIKGEEKTTLAANTDTVTSKGYGAGVKYHWGEWTPFMVYRHDKIGQEMKTLGLTGKEVKTNAMGLGFGRVSKMSEGTSLNYAMSFWRQSKTGHNVLPLNVSVEHDLTTWLVGRAGFEYRLWDRSANVTNSDTTFGRIGASIKVGKASLDWAFGGNSTPGATPTQGDTDSSSFDFANGMFTTASLNYAW